MSGGAVDIVLGAGAASDEALVGEIEGSDGAVDGMGAVPFADSVV